MSPLPNTRVIPVGWAEHHRPVVLQTQTQPATLLRSTGERPPFPLPEGWTSEHPLWEGNVRLQQRNRSEDPVSGLQPTQLREYLVTGPVELLQDLRVGESGDYFLIAGQRYRAMQGFRGSLLWEADILCIFNETQEGDNGN